MFYCYNIIFSSYLPSSQKRLSCHQELLLLIWRLCDSNKKFLHHILKTSEMLDLIVPILHYLNEAREDPCRLGLVHISVFLLLLLSGERNFGVRLNAPWQSKAALDVPSFNGSHGDLLIIVFHKLITSGHARISSLYDCLLTIIVNISPYLKKLTMVTGKFSINTVIRVSKRYKSRFGTHQSWAPCHNQMAKLVGNQAGVTINFISFQDAIVAVFKYF